MTEAEKHFKDVLEAKHHVAGALDGGACIQGDCRGYYKPKDSCSYRWQVVEAYAGGHPLGRHNYYVTPEVQKRVPTARYETAASKERRKADPSVAETFNPSTIPASYPIPQPGDWDIQNGPRENRKITDPTGKHLYTIRKGKNFRKDYWPWWNNAHHLIPKATLRNRIAGVPNPDQWAGPVDLNEVIKCFLLSEKYNVNHYRNMIILPMDPDVGLLIGLPRHLILADAPAKQAAGETATFTDHNAYSIKVNEQLNPIMDAFIEAGTKAGKECVTEEVKATKERLEKLSDRCYKAVTTGIPAGQPISLITAIPARLGTP